jgi:hypothetical protein
MNTPNITLDLVAIAALSVAELTAKLDGLSAEQLSELHALESTAPNGGRVTALAAIEAELERARKLGDESAGDAQDKINGPADGGGENAAVAAVGATPAAAPRGAVADETPKWQHPDYTGPLTGDQATWRHRNLKPVNVVHTK